MSFELWNMGQIPELTLPMGFWGIGILGAYVWVIGNILTRHWSGLTHMTNRRWAALAIGMIIAPIVSTRVTLHLGATSMQANYGAFSMSQPPSLALLAFTPVVLAAGWLGMVPSILVAASGGLGRALWTTHSLFTVCEWIVIASILSFSMHHDDRGRLRIPLHRPLTSALAASAIVWPLGLLSLLADYSARGVPANDYALVLWKARALPLFGELALAGLVGELARFTVPTAWPRNSGVQILANSTKLNQRLLRALVPMAVVGIASIYWANTRIATNVATKMVLDQMVRDAQHAADGIPFFVRTGESLIMDLASNKQLLDASPAIRESLLSQGIRTIPYFQQLIYFDAYGAPVAVSPQPDITQLGLTADELDAVEIALRGAPEQTLSLPPERNAPVMLSFVAPVNDPDRTDPVGALLGRTEIASNPLMLPVTSSLQGLFVGSGTGFITDQNHRIIFHPDPAHLQEIWEMSGSQEQIPVSTQIGNAYKHLTEDGAQWLVYYLTVSGHPWNIVIVVPNSVVLAQARQITVPMALLLLMTGTAGIGFILLISGRITRPLGALANAAEDIIQGKFSQPVRVKGHDEVGRLVDAFERMRKRLRDQLAERELLLRVSQEVAASLDLQKSLPAIMKAALRETDASGVRLILKHPEHPQEALQTLEDGGGAAYMAPLDKEILSLAKTNGQLVLDNLTRARAVLDVFKISKDIQALIALPLMHETIYLGVLWLGYDRPRTFSQTEISLLTTLARLAVMAVSNARLFDESEGDRQLLEAAFGSTPDAVIITRTVEDRSELLLCNPAAEEIFEINLRKEVGRLLSHVIPIPDLLVVMRSTDNTPSTREIPLTDGRTFSALASPILRPDGSVLGRVAVLRDVTHFKKHEQFKSDAVAAISHDLKSPLIMIKGYAGMLPMMGQLNPRQQQYTDQIEDEIDRMSQEIDEVTAKLKEIDSGAKMGAELCDIVDLIDHVDHKVRDTATNKEINLEFSISPDVDNVRGDQTQLRQAIGHLVGNALKYTPAAGRVKVTATVRDEDILITVYDTGVGISSTDQDHVFEKGFRVRSQDVDSPRGSGQGLAFVKSVAERHGGRVWVESQLGKGSKFYLTISTR